MTGRSSYNWAVLYRQMREGIAEEKCKPKWNSIAEYLEIPGPSLRTGMQREFKLTAKDLPGLPASKWPSEFEEIEIEQLPPTYMGITPESVIKTLRPGAMLLSELADKLDRGESKVQMAVRAMMSDGVSIVMERGKAWTSEYSPADPYPTLFDLKSTKVSWLAISDIHIGSFYAQISALLKSIDIAYDRGIRHVLMSGDAVAGGKLYRGQENEIYAVGADDQAEAVIHTLPKKEGLQYYFLGGNHDFVFHRLAGVNVIKMICDQRDDITYVGFDQAEIPILENSKGEITASIVLWHPSGGVPYAISYRGQKIAAEISRKEMLDIVMEEKPAPVVRWIQWGHLHVSDFFPHGPMWVYGPGCFEGTTSYLKSKGLTPVIQAVIVEANITDSGLINASSFHPLQFIEQANDYMCGHIPSMKRRAEKVEPLFSLGK